MLRGAGATFPAPLYERWGQAYAQVTGLGLEYQAVGSAGGLEAVRTGEADFGVSDLALGAVEQAELGVTQFPSAVGGVALVAHLPGVSKGELRLSGEVVARIYLGQVTKWNDPAIAALNPTLSMPDHDIIPIRRRGRSGTTYILSRFLATASPAWQDQVGVGGDLDWPAGVPAGTTAEAALFVERFKYTLGYLPLGQARASGLAWTQMRNASGAFVEPTIAALKAALGEGRWDLEALTLRLHAPQGPAAWPIAGASYILVRTQPEESGRIRSVLRFFDWALREGAADATALGYVSLQGAVPGPVRVRWEQRIRVRGQPSRHASPREQPQAPPCGTAPEGD